MRIKILLGGLVAISALALAGCGGGGSDPDPTPASGVNNVTLGGTAAKGIINLGNVVAEELNADSSILAQVGSATTGIDGSYSLTVSSNYNGGPIQVTISADANTQMKCDVPLGCGTRTDGITDTTNPTSIDFGEWYKPGTLTMTALVAEAAANDTIGVNITPYTDLAASRAMAASSLTAAEIYSANSEVSNLLGGIDILNTQPLDITDAAAIGAGTATEVAYAAFSAAIAALADADAATGQPDIDGALATLESSFSGGTIAADDGGADDTVISLQEIIDGASSTLGQTGTADTSGTLAALQTDVDDAGGTGGTVDPTPSDTTGGTALAKVKAFVSDVRTWGTVIEAETRTQGEAFGTQMDLASTAADSSMSFLIGPALGSALEVAFMNISGTTDTDLTLYTVGMMGDPQFTAGTVTNSAGVITITSGVIDGVTVNMSVLLPADGTTSTLNLGITSATFRSADTDVDINSGTVTVNLATPYTVDWAAIDAGTTTADPDISGGSIDLDVSITQNVGMDEMGMPASLDSPVTFAGNMSTTLTNPITVDETDPVTGEVTTVLDWITPSSLTLGGNISDTAGNSFDASFTVNITNAGSFTPIGELPMNTPRAGIVTWSYVGDTFTLVSPELTLTIQWDSITSSATVTETWRGGYGSSSTTGPYTDITDAVATAPSLLSWYLYAPGHFLWVDGEGGYSIDSAANYSADGSANGTLIEPEFVLEDATSWLDGTVGLTFTLQLAGLPQASVNISGDRTGFEAGTATITIAYDSRQIVIDGSFTNLTSTGSVTITNQDGVSMVVDGDFEASTGDINYNGQTYGSITQLGNGLTKITYIDGTFETL